MKDMQLPELAGQPVVSRAEWQAAREALLAEEKEMTRAMDRLAAKRRELPWVAVSDDYRFVTDQGEKRLIDLFAGRRQLVIYHHMLRPDDPSPCPGCSMLVDELPRMEHLHARDTTLVVVSAAPLAQINAFKQRMGWSFEWVEALGTFNVDFSGHQYGPGYSVFIQNGGRVFYSYGCDDRGTEAVVGCFGTLDITPMGRQEDWQDAPAWVPQTPPYVWWRLHDQYEG